MFLLYFYAFIKTPTRKINYLYNATGQKVAKIVTNNSTETMTDYLNGFHYEDQRLMFFATSEGYVNIRANSKGGVTGVNYVYNYTDHLGNIRVSYTFRNATGQVEIIEENHYYPFGLKHKKYGSVDKDLVCIDEDCYEVGIDVVPPQARKTYQYKYNYREYQDELGLNVTAMDFRQYDNALGRFHSIDALASSIPSITPYHFGFSNPVYWADPSGLMPQWMQSAWDATEEGTNSYWINDGNGNLVNLFNSTGEYSVTLPELYVSGYWYGGDVYLKPKYGSELQNHVYQNSPFYSYFDDLWRTRQLNKLQEGLDYIGMVPVIGEPIDLINAGISAMRGDYVAAGLSLGAMIPVGGYAANAIKIQRHHIIPKAVYRDAGDAVKSVMNLNAGNNLKKLPTPFHGNHPQYNIFVRNQLNAIRKDGVTPGSIQTLQKNLNGMINNAYDNYKATGQNLNDYFRQYNGN